VPPVEIDFPAVPIAALAVFLLGLAWYSKWLFGPLRQRSASGAPVSTVSGALALALCSLVIALVTAVLVSWVGFSTPAQGAWLGVVLWLGPAAALGLGSHLRSGDGVVPYLVDTGYQLIALLLVGALLAGWR